MYDFLRNQWIMRNIDAVTVRSYVHKWINQAEADAILATPQIAV